MHTAHNLAYDLIETELNVCIDSDDMLAENAIKKIIDTWGTIRQDGYAGIIGLDSDFDNHIIGTSFTKEKEAITLSEFYDNGGRGDKKLVYRTSIMKELSRYPEFIGEKLVPLSYKYILCDQKYKLYPINEILCNVEYQANGSTGRIWKQYLESPRGFAEYRKLRMRYSHNKLRIIIDCLHYIANSISAKKKYWIRDSPYPFMTFILLPFGILFLLYIHYKALS
jgi:hypothetical protein